MPLRDLTLPPLRWEQSLRTFSVMLGSGSRESNPEIARFSVQTDRSAAS